MENPDNSPTPLSRQTTYATKEQWNRFLSIFLLAVGAGLTVAGIIFFFAYNWSELPKFAKLGIIEVLLITTVLFSVFIRRHTLIKQILLTVATFLTGTLFAVFGQIYQTGADAYDLFLGWTLFTVLWTIASRFAPLWLVFIGLLSTTIWLYLIQVARPDLWEMSLLANAVTWIYAFAAILAEWLTIKGKSTNNTRWFASLLSLAAIVHASFLTMVAISTTGNEEEITLTLPVLTTLLLFPAGVWFGWKDRNLFYLATIPFATLLILLVYFIIHSRLSEMTLFLIASLIVITGTTLLIYFLLYLKKHWYGTEA